jgi:Ca2+-binding RTX toxin-like protein
MKTTTKMPRALTIESLEDRLALSATSASFSGGMIFVNGDNNASNVSIRQSGMSIRVTDSTNGFVYSRSFANQAALDAARVQFVGGAGNDRVVNYCRNVALQAWGYGGNDYLEGYDDADTLVGGTGDDTLVGYGGDDRMWGEAGNDVLKGMAGNDYLYAGDNDDDLYGGAGYDVLFGQNGSDFLDAGSSYGEYVNGGDGYDFNAYVTAINGTQRDDVHQGGGPTCWLLASLSAVGANTNFANRIVYQGDGRYRVTLFTSTGATRYQYVNFTGERNSADPLFNPNQEGESWTVIMQRAILQEMGLSTTSPPGGNPFYALPMLTGRASSWYGTPSTSTVFGNADAERIRTALANGRYVAMCTFGQGTTLATTKLVNWHCYNVVSISRSVSWVGLIPTYQYTVTVRNPWGYDGGSGSGNTSDALITLSWAQFAGSISGYAVN